MICFDNVSLIANGRMLLRGIDLVLRPGETTVLIGPNGAGKSSLLRLIGGSVVPASGQILFEGRPLRNFGPRQIARRRAVLSQAPTGGDGFTVEELVRLGSQSIMTTARAGITQARIDAALHEVGLADRHTRTIGTLSGGERQRAHLARILVQLRTGAAGGTPGALILDEPIASQDLLQQLRVLEIATAHARNGGMVLMVLHDLNWAAHVADRIVALKDGMIIADGSAHEILTRQTMAALFDVDLVPGKFPTDRPFVLPQTIVTDHDDTNGP